MFKVNLRELHEVKDLHRVLHNLYRNRAFIQLCHGEEYFEQLANSVHQHWLQGGTFLEVTDADIFFAKIGWELENGYELPE